ncbi:MAG: 16S rRNA methyltransferase [Candidatus Thorarchaeota archaeon]|jgi:rRNA small subunit pseudouridine methyltransferase Nep1
MLHIVLLECAIELMPQELTGLKQIQKHAGRRGKKTSDLLLDQTYHGQAMTRLEDGEKRGRPDIAFLCLMTLLESPLCKAGQLSIHLHIQDGRVIKVNPDVRLPRNYDRFVGLIEQLLLRGRVPPEGEPLLQVIELDLSDLLTVLTKSTNESFSILAIKGGKQTTTQDLRALFPDEMSKPVVFGVGAFPHGGLLDSTKNLFSHHVELDMDVMMAWHVCAESLWMYSSKIGVIDSRYRSHLSG